MKKAFSKLSSPLRLFDGSNKSNGDSDQADNGAGESHKSGKKPSGGGGVKGGGTPAERIEALEAEVEALRAEKDASEEQMGQIMDQLATISQQMADARMSKAETDEMNATLTEEVETLRAENASQKEKIQLLRDSVVFENLDSLRQELKEAKEGRRASQEDNARLKREVGALKEGVDQATAKIVELTDNVKAKEAECEGVKEELERSRRHAERVQAQLDEARQAIAELEGRVQEHDKVREQDAEAAEKAKQEALEEQQAQHAEEIEELREEMQTLESQRNSYRTKATSLSKDLQKIVKTSKEKLEQESRLSKENRRLQEELQRRSTSLAHALEALAVSMQESEQMAQTVEDTREAMVRTVEHAAAVAEAGSKKNKTSIGPGVHAAGVESDLETVANKLSSDVAEREDIVSNLRKMNKQLGKQVIELKERLKFYEEADDDDALP